MADNTTLDDYLSKYQGGAASSASSPSGSLDSYLSNYTTPSPAVAAPPSSNPLDSYLNQFKPASPTNGQTEAPQEHLYQDKSQPWYKRAWDFANTPITESVFGLPETRPGAGGFERGAEKILSGFTSPLSIALTAGTFGTGGLIESAGANVLKQTGQFAAEQIPTIMKASEAALEATKALKPLEPVITSALKDVGGDSLVGLVNKAKDVLGPIDLSSRFGEEGIQSVLAKSGKFTEDQLADLAKASKTIQEAKGGFTPVEDAVKSAVGEDGYNLWKQGQEALYNNGLSEHDLLQGNALERGAYHILRNTIPTVSPAVAVRMAKTANTLLSAGFTYQAFETAAAMSPRFLDALKEGDYDAAKEYGTEAAAGAAFGLLGAPHALHAAGELFKPVLENAKFRPNDEWLALDRAAKERDVQHAVAEQEAINLDKTARTALGHDASVDKPQKGLDLATVFHQVVTGGDQDKAAAWYNALAEAAGKEDRIPVSSGLRAYHGSPVQFEGPPHTDGLGAHFSVDPKVAQDFAGTSGGKLVEADLRLKNPLRVEDFGGNHTNAQGVIEDFVKQGVLPESFLDNVKSRIYQRSVELVGPLGDLHGPELSEKRMRAFDEANTEELAAVKAYLRTKGYDGLVYHNKVEGGGDSYVVFDQNQIGRPTNGLLPDNVRDQIAHNNFTKTSPAYQQTILDSLKRVATGDLTDKEQLAAKQLQDEDARNYEIGSANNILHNYLENHMTRLYKETNPEGNVVLSNAKAGKFATNVSMARHQVYDSHITALLKSPKEIVMDPVYAVAQGRAALIKAAANRQFIDTLRDNFTRASDGRPAVVVSGAGKVLQGPNGEDPKTFISPDRLRKINIADGVVQHLTQTGDLQRYLDDGTIRDVTPYVRPDNIAAYIERLENRAGKQEAQYDEVGNNKLRTDIMLLKSMQNNGDYSGLREFNDQLPRSYAFDPQDFIRLEHPSMKDWKFATSDPAGNPVFVNSDIMVHPEFAQYIKDRLGLEPSALQSNPIGKALLGTGTKLKETLLSLSPFHMVQIWLRGLMTGVNPFTLESPDILHGEKVDMSDPNSPTILRKMVEQGYTTGTDYKALQEHSEGVSSGGGLIKYIPLIGKPLANSMNAYQDYLFKRVIPAVKASAGEHMFREYQRLHPDWSVDRAAKAAALHSNRTFGGINWKALGRSVTTQDAMRAVLLAPDWLEAELQSMASLFNPEEGGLQRSQVTKMALGAWGLARVLNLALTGKPNYQAPFAVALKNKEGKEIQYGMRTLPQDILHMISDPVNFVKGRLSPTLHLAQELASQRDNFGRKLSPEDMWIDVFRQTLPIPAQTLGEVATGTGPEIGNPGQLWKSVGGTAVSYQTPAQKLAAQLAANHNEDGPVDASAMAHHRAVQEIEDRVRSGEVSWPQLYQLTYEQDKLKESDLKKIQANYKATREMDPATASLYSRASRLPAPEYFQLYDLLNPTEKTALLPLTKQTIRRYITKAKKDMTPQERSEDPTFNRIMRMLPQMESAEQTQQ